MSWNNQIRFKVNNVSIFIFLPNISGYGFPEDGLKVPISFLLNLLFIREIFSDISDKFILYKNALKLYTLLNHHNNQNNSFFLKRFFQIFS